MPSPDATELVKNIFHPLLWIEPSSRCTSPLEERVTGAGAAHPAVDTPSREVTGSGGATKHHVLHPTGRGFSLPNQTGRHRRGRQFSEEKPSVANGELQSRVADRGQASQSRRRFSQRPNLGDECQAGRQFQLGPQQKQFGHGEIAKRQPRFNDFGHSRS